MESICQSARRAAYGLRSDDPSSKLLMRQIQQLLLRLEAYQSEYQMMDVIVDSIDLTTQDDVGQTLLIAWQQRPTQARRPNTVAKDKEQIVP